MRPLIRVSLSTQRRALIGWGIGLAAIALLYSAVYPSIKQSAADLDKYMQNLPEAMRAIIGTNYTSPAGYLRAELFSLLGPVLLLVFGIGAGGKAVAGEEESRSLDLLLTTPMPRGRVVLDKAITLAITLLALAVLVFVVVIVLGPPFGLHVAIVDVAAMCAMFFLLGLAFSWFALAVGCATGRRAWASAVAGGVAVVTYVLNAIAPSVPGLSWARPLSPFRWYLEPDPLVTGIHPENVLILVAISAACIVAAVWTFGRRDLAA
jgi:beta-exotoxin I transport system permease protein